MQLFTTGTTDGAGIAYPYGAHEFTTGWFFVVFFVALCVVFCGPLLSCRPFLYTIVLSVL